MPYSALFAQSKSYFTHKVRGCQTFLQRLINYFYINILSTFPLSSVPHLFFRSAYVNCRRARHSTAPRSAPRFYPCASPRPNLFFLQKDLSPSNTPDNFRGIAAVISSVLRLRFRIEPYSPPWIIGIRRAAQDIPSFPPKREKRDCRPPLSSYSPNLYMPAPGRLTPHSDRQPHVNIRTGSRRLISRKAFCRRIGRRF